MTWPRNLTVVRELPMLISVFYSSKRHCIERVKEFERVRSAAMARVARDAERLVAAAEPLVESFRARLTAVERENLEACGLRACAIRLLKFPFVKWMQCVLLACELRAGTWRQRGGRSQCAQLSTRREHRSDDLGRRAIFLGVWR